MIDIHTHILPDVDDGARGLAEALSMARVAVEDGITHMFATPHHRDYTRLSRLDVAERVTQLQAKLDTEHIPITLLPGYEVRMYPDMFDDWDKGFAGPLGSSHYVLAEPEFRCYDAQTEAMLFELFDRGFMPIMAHPERIIPLQNNLALIEPFLMRGGLTQITSGSLTHDHDRRAREVADEMLSNGMVHIIASDAHKPYRRKPVLSEARDIAAKIVGYEQAEAMVSAHPMAVVNNQPIATQPVYW